MASNSDIDYQPKGKKSKFSGAREFLYNPEDKSVLGRTGISWLKIGVFYFVFYACLAGFFAIWLSVFFAMVDSNSPRQYGMTSLLKNNPGMGFRPQPDVETTLIHFTQGKPETYSEYTKNIQAVLDIYENDAQNPGAKIDDCVSENRDPNKACIFKISDLGPECTREKTYGYNEGQPCVMLKMNKVYDYTPEPFTNSTPPSDEALDAGLRGRWQEDYVGVTCEGENPADQENMGNLTFWPPAGFPMRYYPYMNQEGYRQPLVMVQFSSPKNGVVIQMWCKVWTQDIYHHRNDKAGSVHFELLVD